MDKLHEECGIMAVVGDREAAKLVYLGLYALQHRGQEACGIVAMNVEAAGDQPALRVHKAFGLVADNFSEPVLETLPGDLAVGHVRYSTQGGASAANIQPFHFISESMGPVALAHNGNLRNAAEVRRDLDLQGGVFSSSSDTEVLIHLVAKAPRGPMNKRIEWALGHVRGAFSLAIAAEGKLFAIRDPNGFRPLVLGRRGEAWVVASESCALDLIDAEWVREVLPGEIVTLQAGHEPVSQIYTRGVRMTQCAFEPIYFSRPDSRLFGVEIYEARKRMGEVLAEESKIQADLVMAVPDSGVPMALGYSHKSGLPMELGLVRNHYVGRTFIEPTQAIRDFGVRLKLNPLPSTIRGKRVVVIDDSIVRGTTSVKIVRMLRRAGAAEVHLRVGSPPITHPCFYGVDTPEREQLLAAQKSVVEMCEWIGADSLAFLSVEGLKKALGRTLGDSSCLACFGGVYPV